MEAKAKLNYLRISPRKVRLIADLIRGKKAQKAQVVLQFSVKKASLPILKLLNSAIASARNNHNLDEANLYISKITVDEGPKLKRWRARSRGQSFGIQKKTSHVSLVLSEISKTKKKKVKKIEKNIEKKEVKEKKEKPKFKSEKKIIKSNLKTSKRMFRRKSF